MNNNIFFALTALVFFIVGSSLAIAGSTKPKSQHTHEMHHATKTNQIIIKAPWTRATPGASKSAGGFLILENVGNLADKLVHLTSPAAAKVEIHTMNVTDGVMRMRRIKDGITINPGEIVELKPGSLHIMFMGLTKKFVTGENVLVTLTFKKSGEVTVMLPIMAMGTKAHHHSHMKKKKSK